MTQRFSRSSKYKFTKRTSSDRTLARTSSDRSPKAPDSVFSVVEGQSVVASELLLYKRTCRSVPIPATARTRRHQHVCLLITISSCRVVPADNQASCDPPPGAHNKLVACSLVSKSFRDLALPYLFRRVIVFFPPEEEKISQIPLARGHPEEGGFPFRLRKLKSPAVHLY